MNESARVLAIEPVRKSIRVAAPVAHAFDVFTNGLHRWWPSDYGVARKPIEKMVLETRIGGRWLEISKDGSQTCVATVTAWDPPHRVTMLWQINAKWEADAAMKSEVDIRFIAEGTEATRVELLHHKFESMGAEAGASMRKDVDGGWPGLMERFAREAERGLSKP